MALASFDPSAKGKNGSATMNFTDGSTINGFSGFGVVNDVTTYSEKQLRAVEKKRTGSDPGRIAGMTMSGLQNGLYFDPHTNYTVNELRGQPTTKLDKLVGLQLSTQVHELGNSISDITGLQFSSSPREKDEDEGMAFENCVAKNY
jgi:hypothetical protein